MATDHETGHQHLAGHQHQTEHLAVHQSLELLRSAPVGRLAVVIDGEPAIFPVNHVVDRGTIVFRTGAGMKLAAATGQMVAYEVDGYDLQTGIAWSVVVTGKARQVRMLHEVLEAMDLPVTPWEGSSKPHVVRIEPTTITGRRFQIRAAARAQQV
ncbi:MAG TPA: pyridoxamine 5'-phosphate oxidase family protein [Ruania sp.]|nr:pyridoxamine 5'-phosphate oxidase family protein [Ruania sp.]